MLDSGTLTLPICAAADAPKSEDGPGTSLPVRKVSQQAGNEIWLFVWWWTWCEYKIYILITTAGRLEAEGELFPLEPETGTL